MPWGLIWETIGACQSWNTTADFNTKNQRHEESEAQLSPPNRLVSDQLLTAPFLFQKSSFLEFRVCPL
jgi:hypothetical protein